jgi:hypothetical protein
MKLMLRKLASLRLFSIVVVPLYRPKPSALPRFG